MGDTSGLSMPGERVNPYAAPLADAGARSLEAPAGSFARLVSLVLAGIGVVGFWGTLAAFVLLGDGEMSELEEGAVAAVMAIAATCHLVAGAVVFAGPRGKRLVGALANGIALLAISVLMLLGALR